MLSLIADILTSWLAVPALLALLSLGLGRLVALGADDDRVRTLQVPVGFAALIGVTQLVTWSPHTSRFAVPAAASLALAGLLLNPPRRTVRGRRGSAVPHAFRAGIAVYLVSFAPVLGALRPTYLGWIKMDETASYFAYADQLLDGGRTLADMAPSTYQAVVSAALSNGTPLGALGPMGVVARLLRTDQSLVVQPYISFALAMFGIAAYTCLRAVGLRARTSLLGVVAAGGSALVLGFAWWGGVREVVMVALLVTAAACIDDFSPAVDGTRRLLPLAVTVGAATSVYAPTAWLWLALPLWQLWRKYEGDALPHRRDDLVLAAAVAAAAAAPTLASFGGLSAYRNIASTTQAIDDPGVLTHALSMWQVAGIWPAGDFRDVPSQLGLVRVLAALVLLLALSALWRPRGTSTLPSLAVGAVALVLLGHDGTAWIGAKALVIASPFVMLMAWDGIDRLARTGRELHATAITAALATGLVWSAAVAYHEVWPAPLNQARELQAIARDFDGAGPALLIEYNPLAGRHLLRGLEIETAGDANSGTITLIGGDPLPASTNADLDDFALKSVEQFPTLVLRNDPRASRPPTNYAPVYTGTYYSVWQAKDDIAPPKTHIALGSATSKGAVPQCSAVTDAASGSSKLIAAAPTDGTVVNLSDLTLPAGWKPVQTGVLPKSGTLAFTVDVATAGEHSVWLGGWTRGVTTITIDGTRVASGRGVLNPPGSPTPFGTVELSAGTHAVEITYSASPLVAGTGGVVDAMGPFMLRSTSTTDQLITVTAATASQLCGKAWDWIDVY